MANIKEKQSTYFTSYRRRFDFCGDMFILGDVVSWVSLDGNECYSLITIKVFHF
jgi:hypothetical protein